MAFYAAPPESTSRCDSGLGLLIGLCEAMVKGSIGGDLRAVCEDGGGNEGGENDL